MAKYIVDGIEFDSKLEADHYAILKSNPNIEILNDHQTFELYPKHSFKHFPRLKTAHQQPIRYTPDFILRMKGLEKPVAMESKGYARKEYMLRKKLFMLKYSREYYFYQCKSVKQLKDDLEKLKGELKWNDTESIVES